MCAPWEEEEEAEGNKKINKCEKGRRRNDESEGRVGGERADGC